MDTLAKVLVFYLPHATEGKIATGDSLMSWSVTLGFAIWSTLPFFLKDHWITGIFLLTGVAVALYTLYCGIMYRVSEPAPGGGQRMRASNLGFYVCFACMMMFFCTTAVYGLTAFLEKISY